MGKRFIDITGKYYITRVSRWIDIKTLYDISPKHSLYEFVEDANGYKPGNDRFNPNEGVSVDYITIKGKKYAISQFYRIGTMFCPGDPYKFIDTDGKIKSLCAVDYYGDLYHPYYLELDDSCERVRVYEVRFISESYPRSMYL